MDAVTRTDQVVDAEASSWTRRLLLWVLPIAVIAVAGYFYGTTGRYVSTDNAYLQQDRVDVAPQVSASVTSVFVDENAHINQGQPVLQLDDSTFRIAVAAAEARLSAARAEVAALKAAYREKVGEIAVAQQSAEYAGRELRRQQELANRKLTAIAQLDAASRSATLAAGTVTVLDLQLGQSSARLGGNPDLPTDSYPAVRTAIAEFDRARLDLDRTIIRAPQAGIASHLPKVGNRIEIGRAAFAIVTDRSLWVEANFKETDLEWVRQRQSVDVAIDTYGHHHWHGHVESIAQATGAEFSLLPAQNASGNWVKVVQRIPVRITLDRKDGDPPLRDGMSATVEIDTGPHTRFDRWFGRER
jgi:membrane fusion protein, multidrug efflux system